MEGCPDFSPVVDIRYCDGIESLEGGPQRCKKIDIEWCNNLKSLKGCPTVVSDSFNVTFCSKLNQIDYMPKGEVGQISFQYNGKYFEDTPKSEIYDRLEELGCSTEDLFVV